MVTFLSPTTRVVPVHLEDAVDEEERIAVGQRLDDALDVHHAGSR